MNSQTCPIGFFCFDKKTSLLVVVTLTILTLHLLNIHKFKLEVSKNQNGLSYNQNGSSSHNQNNYIENNSNMFVDNYRKNLELDYQRVTNPLIPPERSYPYRTNCVGVPIDVSVPINIPTRGYTPRYQQVGVITKKNDSGEPTILPLYGKPTYPGSSKWLYYTGTDKFNPVKLPITNNGRECQGDSGCNEIYSGDTINVPAYDNDFETTIYQIDKPRYLPYVY